MELKFNIEGAKKGMIQQSEITFLKKLSPKIFKFCLF